MASLRATSDLDRELTYWREQHAIDPDVLGSIVAARSAELAQSYDPGERRLGSALELLAAQAPTAKIVDALGHQQSP